MSRIGKLPIAIPDKVKIDVDEKTKTVTIEGPKGKLVKAFRAPVAITIEEGELRVAPTAKDRHARAMYGTTRSILSNMVAGVVDGYSKDLEIQGTGYRAAVNGQKLDLALGYSHPIKYTIPQGITVTVTDNTKVKVEGPDKHLVGQVAADIKHFNKAEPYKGKGVRIVGEFVRSKEGKKAG